MTALVTNGILLSGRDPANDQSDGRSLRRDKNIDRVINAAIELFRESPGTPSIDEIAQRAGLATRSLYRYFDDAASLYFAVAEHNLQALHQRAAIPLKLPKKLRDRAIMLAEWRWPMHEEFRNVADSLRRFQEKNNLIGELRRAGSRFLEEQIERYFAPELNRLGDGRAPVLLSLRVLWSVEAWSVLSFDLDHNQVTVSETIVEATTKLLRA